MFNRQSKAETARALAQSAAIDRSQAVIEFKLDGTIITANQNFLNLQEELTSSEDKVAYARQYYNDSVLNYNTQIQKFPTVLLAGMFHFEKREFFDAAPEDTEPVQVQF